MAHIIGGIAASHTPTIGFAYGKEKQDPLLPDGPTAAEAALPGSGVITTARIQPD